VEADRIVAVAFDDLSVDAFHECLFAIWRLRFVAFREMVFSLADEADGGEIDVGCAKGFGRGVVVAGWTRLLVCVWLEMIRTGWVIIAIVESGFLFLELFLSFVNALLQDDEF
jgi:hypothetical protein